MNIFHKKVKIGNIYVDGSFALAPMAGITDTVFRCICSDFGAPFVFTEMISAKGIINNNKNTNDLLKINEKREKVVLQIFGNDPYIMAKAIEKVNNINFLFININMACPVKKIVSNGEGSALMLNPKLAKEIVKTVKKSTDKPITVKIRKGFKLHNDNAVEFSKYLEDGGADLIIIHGRSRDDYYNGSIDFDIIKEVKKNISIPVFGSGNIWTACDAYNMIKKTNVDGILVARGAKGNPWIFKDILNYNNLFLIKKITMNERIFVIKKHIKDFVDVYGENNSFVQLRKHITWYVKGVHHSTILREEINKIKCISDVYKIFEKLYKYINK